MLKLQKDKQRMTKTKFEPKSRTALSEEKRGKNTVRGESSEVSLRSASKRRLSTLLATGSPSLDSVSDSVSDSDSSALLDSASLLLLAAELESSSDANRMSSEDAGQ